MLGVAQTNQRESSNKNISQIKTFMTNRKKKSVRSDFGGETGKTGFMMKLKKIFV